ncbi:hypothetical protein ACH5RR_030189 [Cinchona calisaya]|uniref:Uncharacterized protein n=1 Tax=Cinchona calisaya TaxID=153742 RepID=A0ABD2YV30_9GENT
MIVNRSGYESGFTTFSKKVKKDTCQEKRVKVFALFLLSLLVFPRENGMISIRLAQLLIDVFDGVDDKRLTLVPTILAEIFIACTACQGPGRPFLLGRASCYWFGPLSTYVLNQVMI